MDIKKFKATAKRKKGALSAFLDKLDTIVPEDMPDIVAKADEEVWKEVHCGECAHCCKTMTPTFNKGDIDRISAYLEITPRTFKKRWLKQEDEFGDWVNTTQPCQFLEDNQCTIYAVRPQDCAEFPHHNKKPFDEYNETFKNNLVHCPATLLLIDKLKKTVEEGYVWE